MSSLSKKIALGGIIMGIFKIVAMAPSFASTFTIFIVFSKDYQRNNDDIIDNLV